MLTWPPEHDEFILGLWGKQPASGIAKAFSAKFGRQVTRNTILGRISRLRTDNPGRRISIRLPDKIDEIPDGVTTSMPLLEAKNNNCRWILSQPGQFVCGAITEADSPWCPYHKSRVEGRKSKIELEKIDTEKESLLDNDIHVRY